MLHVREKTSGIGQRSKHSFIFTILAQVGISHDLPVRTLECQVALALRAESALFTLAEVIGGADIGTDEVVQDGMGREATRAAFPAWTQRVRHLRKAGRNSSNSLFMAVV